MNVFQTRLEHWRRNGYTSHNLSLDSSDEEEEEPEGVELRYMVGDVTCPQNTGKADTIVVHCVGKFKVHIPHRHSLISPCNR